MNDKQKQRWEEVRGAYARILHKTIRQFEVEGCPETFNLKVHIDQLLKLVEIPDPDQSKPNNPIHPKTQADSRRFDCYNLAQVDMDDWIKIILRDKG